MARKRANSAGDPAMTTRRRRRRARSAPPLDALVAPSPAMLEAERRIGARLDALPLELRAGAAAIVGSVVTACAESLPVVANVEGDDGAPVRVELEADEQRALGGRIMMRAVGELGRRLLGKLGG